MKHQPTYTSLMRKLAPLIVVTLMLSGLLASCASVPASIYEDHFATSFEASVFYPCGMNTHTEFVEGVGDVNLGYLGL